MEKKEYEDIKKEIKEDFEKMLEYNEELIELRKDAEKEEGGE